jgi:integrase
MAWLEKRGDAYRLNFRIGGRRFTYTCQTERDARELKQRAERRLEMIKLGDLVVPEGVDLKTFVVMGKTAVPVAPEHPLRFKAAIDEYFRVMPDDSMEQSSINTTNTHLKHLQRLLGKNLDIRRLSFSDLQEYVTTRSGESGRQGRVSPVTIRKEIATLSGLWGWLLKAGLATIQFPGKGLRYSKTDEKPPFQTRTEIERQIAGGGITELEQAALWECLYLGVEEIDQVLDEVQIANPSTFLYPMLVVAAHSGARRSELLRSQIRDIDFDGGTLTLRERKRDNAQRTTRRVPLSDRVRKTLEDWLDGKRTGSTFSHREDPVTVNQATNHLKNTLGKSNWSVIRGWHVFRHSFISNCATCGIDQRIIDTWVGHQTDAMRRRYTHLLPNVQQAAMTTVFGSD